jgi:serine/threonine protein phosphatase PrpC
MAKDCGVITEPDILEYKLTHKSKYLLICSDGVWKHLTNQDVINLGKKYFQKGEIVPHCTLLVKKAVQEWEKVNIIRDDITIVCVYF